VTFANNFPHLDSARKPAMLRNIYRLRETRRRIEALAALLRHVRNYRKSNEPRHIEEFV